MDGLSLGDGAGGLTFDAAQNDNQPVDLELCLVGRFLTDRSIRVHIMRERLAGIWRSGKGVSIKELDNGIFLFQLFHKLDLVRVFNGGHWIFDNFLLILEKVQPGEALTQIPLCHVNFWVQVHDFPAGFMTPIVG